MTSATGTAKANARAPARSRWSRTQARKGTGANQPVAFELSVIPKAIPKSTAPRRLSLAGAKAAQARIQQLVSGPSKEAKWAWANNRGSNIRAATAAKATAVEYSRTRRWNMTPAARLKSKMGPNRELSSGPSHAFETHRPAAITIP
ncbi:MAG: hypothetical protein A2V98_13135 [Planctomycetes bacterium RBG_16_64_12]|nr:MAG: hypothetical protein A2V98_13135 [Planctomycetes bacterium RBG_16_64_12]